MRDPSGIGTFDLAGRMVCYFDGQSHYWRGLSGITVRKWTDSAGRKQAEALDTRKGLDILEQARSLLRGIPHPSPEVGDVIRRALDFDPEADEAAFRRVYGSVGILPPDQYLALVLQVATGCAWNRCTFCHFYRDQVFQRLTPAQFRLHVGAVLDFLGDSRLLRRSIFLGDADVFAVPTAPLLEMIEFARDRVGLDNVVAFGEAVSVSRRPRNELAQLAAAGLRRIYIGAETGLDSVLEVLQKRSRVRDVAAAVALLKEAGLQASLIFLAGLGDPDHPAATARLARELPLGPGDLVYVSRLWGAPDDVAEAELQQLRQRLTFLQDRGVKVAPYDIRQFVY